MLKTTAAGSLNKDNPVRIRKGEWAQNDRIDHAEYGSRYAHAKGQGENNSEGKTGGASQLAHRIS